MLVRGKGGDIDFCEIVPRGLCVPAHGWMLSDCDASYPAAYATEDEDAVAADLPRLKVCCTAGEQ